MSQIIEIAFTYDVQEVQMTTGNGVAVQNVQIELSSGPIGPAGPTGPTGPTGPQGPTGSSNVTIATKTANYTITLTDGVILVDATSGNIAISLPAPGTSTGIIFTVKKIDSSVHTVTITPVSGQIENGSNAVLKVQGASVDPVSNGTNYNIK